MKIESSNTQSFENPSGFIVLDGVNGAGKTTLQNKVIAYLREKDFNVLGTKEPGAGTLGKIVRPIILDPPQKLSPRVEMFLFSADRAQHVDSIIRPAISEKKLVVSDRYYYSTAVFQGYGRGLDHELVSNINSIAIDGLLPDFVLLLDLDPIEGLKRNKKNGDDERDGFEEEAFEFQRKIRSGFLELSESLPEPFLVLDASQGPEEVFQSCIPLLDSWIEALRGRK